jgi:hypothetical protein
MLQPTLEVTVLLDNDNTNGLYQQMKLYEVNASEMLTSKW